MLGLPKSIINAAVIAVLLIGYFGLRAGLRGSVAATPDTAVTQSETRSLTTVVVQTIALEPHVIFADFKGRTEPNRSVTVRSETSGVVTDARIDDGSFVNRGAILCGLAVETRSARIAEAEARVAAQQLDYDSAAELERKGWTTASRTTALKASLDQAEAALVSARLELQKTFIRAPFNGVFETRFAEQGDFLAPGGACGEIVDLDPIIVSFEASEDEIGGLKLGETANIMLANGAAVSGNVRYVARTADARTRTFRAEVAVENPESILPSGVTASLRIEAGMADAALLSPASLVLHDNGSVGVRYVNDDNIIAFAAVEIIDDVPEGIWVTGLMNGASVLVEGQDFVREGTEVTAVPVEDI
ncbi:MAG: efflux RND transporter periplasmic adaptor subunit [Henriciella sp.]